MSLHVQAETRTTPRLTAVRRFEPLTPLAADVSVARTPRRSPATQQLARAGLLALGYYAGARIGFLLQSPLVPQSVLWLPNSILFAALIVSPPRRWLLLLMASMPAQLLVGWQSHAPLEAMSFLYGTNCADAALAATVWRLISPGQIRIEGLRRMLGFIVLSATLPTLLVSFADAGITVATGWSSNYWLAYGTRARANILTNIMFVPAAVATMTAQRADLVRQMRARWLEAAVLLTGLSATGFLAFGRPINTITTATLAYLPLIFIVWCAVRFGVAMTGTAMLALAYLTTWLVVREPGHATHPVGEVPALQFELLAIVVPVLCLCAVVQEREGASRALAASQHALNQSLAQIRNLAGRLLTATEEERTRIARELHDDINQQLAALGIGLSALKRRMPNDDQLRNEVGTLQRQAMHTADTVRALSHELHPAALRHAGLVPAMRELCAQYGRSDEMRAVLSVTREINVSHDVALCAYRVTQEALRNAARHSGASAAYVSLRTDDQGLELRIEDDGMGFDQPTARRRGGLGLTSIDERVRLVGGTVHVDTAPGHGTRIFLHVPFGEFDGTTETAPRR